VVNNPVGGVDGISDVRVVEHWPYVQGAPLSDDHDFADGSFGGAPQEDEGDNDSQRGRRGRFTGSSPLAPFPVRSTLPQPLAGDVSGSRQPALPFGSTLVVGCRCIQCSLPLSVAGRGLDGSDSGAAYPGASAHTSTGSTTVAGAQQERGGHGAPSATLWDPITG
jgi:hypothetical protein